MGYSSRLDSPLGCVLLTGIAGIGTLQGNSMCAVQDDKGCTPSEVEMMTEFSEYFCRNQGALTLAQQEALQQSRVAVVGCGGLGGYVIEALVRIGVGRMLLVDPDVFTVGNCNRQLNALGSTLGRNKAEVAAARSEAIHPFCTVTPVPLDFRSVVAVDWDQVEVVVDCLDSIPARYDLAALCSRLNLPLVHGAVNGWYGQVGVQLPGGDLLARLYPERMENQPQAAPSVLSFTVATVASLQASEVIKLLLGMSSSLHKHWMHIDLKHCDFLLNA
jgi:molybdopterin/thiamine biosynthesis adenylyltransferase